MISRAADYALRAILTLVGRSPGARMSLGELAEECEVPPAYLYKVLRILADKGLLLSRRGKSGGYELTPVARTSSVVDVVDALNGLPVLNLCLMTGGCHRSPTCPAHPVWVLAQERVRETLASARVADLAGAGPEITHPGARQVPRVRPARCRHLPPGRERDDRVPRGAHRNRMGDR